MDPGRRKFFVGLAVAPIAGVAALLKEPQKPLPRSGPGGIIGREDWNKLIDAVEELQRGR